MGNSRLAPGLRVASVIGEGEQQAGRDRHMGSRNRTALCTRLLDVIENEIAPRTQAGVAAGNKAFGAAILRKADLSLVVAEANRETENPLLHGEIAALNAFYRLPAADRPSTADCLFVSTHESCPLCLSAITWTGFDNFYYLFDYLEVRDDFHIPHNLKIHKEVFSLPAGNYRRHNAFWHSHGLKDLATDAKGDDAARLADQIGRIKATFVALADAYQKSKTANDIPLN